MNVQLKQAGRPSTVTTGRIGGSRKLYSSPEGAPEIKVPCREIALADEAALRLYEFLGTLWLRRFLA